MQIPVVNVKNMNTVYGKKGGKSIIRIKRCIILYSKRLIVCLLQMTSDTLI